MNPELALFVLKKIKMPSNFRAGLIISVIIFKGFDINGLVKHNMRKDPKEANART